MSKVNSEIKKVVTRVKAAQTQLQEVLKSQDWVDEARKYAERQGKEVKKILTDDVGKMKTFLERERKELERIQKQIPGEVDKLRKFIAGQRKEFEKLLTNVRKLNVNGKTKATKKPSSAKKKTSSAGKKTTTSGTSASAPESTTSTSV
jgi:hypothetical protein